MAKLPKVPPPPDLRRIGIVDEGSKEPSDSDPPESSRLGRGSLEQPTGWTPLRSADPQPVEQQIYDSRDVTRADESGFGSEAFATGAFGGGGFNTAPFNSETLNDQLGPATRILAGENSAVVPGGIKAAPEYVPMSIAPTAGTSPVFGGSQPPQPDPSIASGSVIVTEGSAQRVVHDSLTVSEATSPTLDKVKVTHQLRALIATFEDIDAYDPVRHHNRAPPLWSDDPDFRKNVKDLLAELRRLNDLLEAGKEPTPAVASKMGKVLVQGAATVYKAACATIGAGLGALILGSFIEILAQLGLRAEINAILSWVPKGK